MGYKSIQVHCLLTLQPQRMAEIYSNFLSVKDVNTLKETRFDFEEKNIYSLMLQTSKWCNVELEFRDNVGNIPFHSAINQYADLDSILRSLELGRGINPQEKAKR